MTLGSLFMAPRKKITEGTSDRTPCNQMFVMILYHLFYIKHEAVTENTNNKHKIQPMKSHIHLCFRRSACRAGSAELERASVVIASWSFLSRTYNS